METNPGSDEAAAALADAESSAARLASELRLPSFFHGSIGVAITVQIATSALGIAVQEAWAANLFLTGLGLFLAVAAVQLRRFRRINGAWVWALANKVVFGSGTAASVTYCLAFAAALVAAAAEVWWLVPPAAVAGGVGYAVGGQRWLRAYRRDPTGLGRGAPIGWLAAAFVLATTGLVLLVSAR
jgi:uncharacterized membrane protein YhaH (DUF805 family)